MFVITVAPQKLICKFLNTQKVGPRRLRRRGETRGRRTLSVRGPLKLHITTVSLPNLLYYLYVITEPPARPPPV